MRNKKKAFKFFITITLSLFITAALGCIFWIYTVHNLRPPIISYHDGEKPSQLLVKMETYNHDPMVTLYYAIDAGALPKWGMLPLPKKYIKYTGPFLIDRDHTSITGIVVKFGIVGNFHTSELENAAPSLSYQLTLDPDYGLYLDPQDVTITSKKPNTVITYAIDGSPPRIYTKPVRISKTSTLHVIVAKNSLIDEWKDEHKDSFEYTIMDVPFPRQIINRPASSSSSGIYSSYDGDTVVLGRYRAITIVNREEGSWSQSEVDFEGDSLLGISLIDDNRVIVLSSHEDAGTGEPRKESYRLNLLAKQNGGYSKSLLYEFAMSPEYPVYRSMSASADGSTIVFAASENYDAYYAVIVSSDNGMYTLHKEELRDLAFSDEKVTRKYEDTLCSRVKTNKEGTLVAAATPTRIYTFRKNRSQWVVDPYQVYDEFSHISIKSETICYQKSDDFTWYRLSGTEWKAMDDVPRDYDAHTLKGRQPERTRDGKSFFIIRDNTATKKTLFVFEEESKNKNQ